MNKPSFDVSIKEARSVIDLIEKVHGDRFTDFSLAVFSSRFNYAMGFFGFRFIDQFVAALRANEDSFYDRFLDIMIPRTTEMFRDPTFWRELRQQIIPDLLRVHGDRLRIWQACLDSGEELFSLLIVLEELGVRGDCQVYSSYMGERVRERIMRGYLPMSREEVDGANYGRYSRLGSLDKYVTRSSERRIFDTKLLSGVDFKRMQPEFSSWSGAQVHLVLCRNMFLYFTLSLCGRNVQVLSDSLMSGGVLALGVKESLENIPNSATFTLLNGFERIYRRRRE